MHIMFAQLFVSVWLVIGCSYITNANKYRNKMHMIYWSNNTDAEKS
jgi:hypothetical protein